MKALRWGIVGCGDVCEVKSGPAFQKIDGSELLVVCRRDGNKAEDFALRHNVPRWTTEAQEVIDDPEVDIVYVATPPGSHLEIAERVAKSGKPCYVEKPMARSGAECRAMLAAFEAVNQKLFVAYYRRCLPRFVAVKRLLEAEQIGTLTSVNLVLANPAMLEIDPAHLPWRIDVERSGAGLFLDLGSHALDVLDYLLGPIVDVAGRARRVVTSTPVEDNVSMYFTHACGASGTAMWDFASVVHCDSVEIRGTRGCVRFAVFGRADVTVTIDGQTETTQYPDPPHVHQPLVQTIVDELSGRGDKCPSTGRSAARTSEVMDKVLDGYYAGRADDFWTRPKTWNPI